MYQVLARRWRPQSFAELVGQQHVTQTLANAIESDRLAHAYIFSGLRGTGKTTAARILAKCLNCEQGPTTAPCGKCAACVEIAESRAIDVLEVDAASRTKVEQTRELLEMIAYAPARDRYKILIIDEAHMLSKASFNALLKTLEEPPPNVLFILATTEIQKILPTILSRCQVFEFRRVGPRELAEHLARICADEKIEASPITLDRLARSGEGSVRDALSLLERAVAFCGNRLDDGDVLRMLGGVRTEVLASAIAGLAARDAAGMLTVLDGVADEGHDLTHFWTELVGALRDLLVMNSLPGQDDLLSRSPDEAATLRDAAGDLTMEDLSRAFQLLADLEPALKGSSRPRYMFEAALIRLASLGAVRPIEEVLRSIGSPEAKGSRGPQKKNPARRPEPPRPVAAQPVDRAETPVAPTEPRERPASSGSLAERLIGAVREDRPMVGAILEEASSIRLDDGRLTIAFDGSATAMTRTLERKESLELITRFAAELVGAPVQVHVETGAPTVDAPVATAAPSTAGVEPAAAKRTAKTEREPTEALPGEPGAEQDDLLKRATAEPGVQQLLREFGAQVVDIQPLGRAKRTTGRASRRRPLEDTP